MIKYIYLHPVIFSGIDQLEITGRSISQMIAEKYYMQPVGGRQNFRIGYLTGKKALSLAVTGKTPILMVKRFVHFFQAENAVYSELFCRTDRFVFSQTIGGLVNA